MENNNSESLKTVATKIDLSELKAELIKWMFLFWLGQFASITAVLFLFFKK